MDSVDLQYAHELAGKMSLKLGVDAQLIKPCIGVMFNTSFTKGGAPDRSLVASILASEMKRMGISQEKATDYILKWNEPNNPPKSQSEILSTIRTAYRKDYNYSCRHWAFEGCCVGKDMCVYYKGALSKRKYYNNRVFYNYRWQLILSSAQHLIYHSLIELERKRGVGAGGLIIANHKQIAYFSGITPKYIGVSLQNLQSFGLIKYKAGIPRKWEGKASEIRRIVPIPKPKSEHLKKIPAWINADR